MKIFLLTDYRGQFYSSTRSRGASLDVKVLVHAFGKLGFEAVTLRLADIDLRCDNFLKIPVLYQSSEDPNLHYKDYVEDILLGLELQGESLFRRSGVFARTITKSLWRL